MTKFQIESKAGVVLGTYEGETKQAAFCAMLNRASDTYGEPHVGTEADYILIELPERAEAERLIAAGKPIYITSGEGAAGAVEEYDGSRAPEAIAARLESERAGGDRWARAKVLSHDNGAPVYIDIETGDYCS